MTDNLYTLRADGRVTMWQDQILEEIYKIREEHAKSFNYDLQAICDDLQKKQARSGRQIISDPLKQPSLRHNKSLHPSKANITG